MKNVHLYTSVHLYTRAYIYNSLLYNSLLITVYKYNSLQEKVFSCITSLFFYFFSMKKKEEVFSGVLSHSKRNLCLSLYASLSAKKECFETRKFRAIGNNKQILPAPWRRLEGLSAPGVGLRLRGFYTTHV